MELAFEAFAAARSGSHRAETPRDFCWFRAPVSNIWFQYDGGKEKVPHIDQLDASYL
jgi:hypothetical protein